MASIDEARALVGTRRFGEALAVLTKARISPLRADGRGVRQRPSRCRRAHDGAAAPLPLLATLARIECELIRVALNEHGGNVNAVAKALGISRKSLYLKRQRLGL